MSGKSARVVSENTQGWGENLLLGARRAVLPGWLLFRGLRGSLTLCKAHLHLHKVFCTSGGLGVKGIHPWLSGKGVFRVPPSPCPVPPIPPLHFNPKIELAASPRLHEDVQHPSQAAF